jgi:hypothetical protein
MLNELANPPAQNGRKPYVPSIYPAGIYSGLRDLNSAFKLLDRAYDERCEYLVYMAREPMADPLRHDPRFSSLLQRVGLHQN